LKGVSKLLHSSSKIYDPPLAETISEIIHRIVSTSSDYTHVVSAHSALGKSVLPRVAGTLDLPAISDVTSVEHDSASNATTFTRPIYAGNAIATVKAPGSVNVKFFTVRGTAFEATTADEVNESVEVEKVEPVDVPDLHTKHVSASLTKSSRPELSSASRVVSGGRALKSAESFNSTLDPLADVLGAAVGASRAAVDSGYADNSLQVGQTGKVVAPELYVAVGISGAIQHLAGMKDSKCIVAINKVSYDVTWYSLN
jgi:electron transfer flavoprotein alpha subunit